MDNNTHINEYIVKNHLIKNINLNWDIIIHKPEFLTKNISNVVFFLTNENGQKSLIFDGLLFRIIFNPQEIYVNLIKSDLNIFEYSDIPFEYIIYHEGFFVLENIPKEKIKLILDYKVNFIFTDSQILPHYLPNVLPNEYIKQWNIGIKENEPNKNKLKILLGMVGCSYNSSQMDNNFYNQNHKIIYNSNNLTQNLLKINYLNEKNNWVNEYENNFDIYSINNIINVLITKKNSLICEFNQNLAIGDFNQLNEYFEVISETLKIPINNICQKNTNVFISTNTSLISTDGITNIIFLCDNNKYNILKISLDLKIKNVNVNNNYNGDNTENNIHELEFNVCEQGYIILGLSNFFIIPTMINISYTLIIEFEINNFNSSQDLILNNNNHILSNEFDDFWIKYDRITMDTSVRNKLGKSKNDYVEYPIVDILDYY